MPDFTPILAEAQRLRGISAGSKTAVKRAAGTLNRRLPIEARRDIQTEYTLQASRVSPNIQSSNDGSTVTLVGKARAVGLVEFQGRWSGRRSAGASAKPFVGQGAHVYAGTFIARGKGGNRQIFDRALVGGKRAPRLPLKTLYGPSIASMLRKPARVARLEDIARNILADEITRLL